MEWVTNYDMPYKGRKVERYPCVLDRLYRLERITGQLRDSIKKNEQLIEKLECQLAKSKWFPF